MELKDSGSRQEFSTGSVRDSQEGKGYPHMVHPAALRAIAAQLERGAAKYGARNWEKGQNLARYYDSLMRHLWSWIEGATDEPHLDAALWNLHGIVATIAMVENGELPSELLDLPPGERRRRLTNRPMSANEMARERSRR